MTRNWDTMRAIMLKLEAAETAYTALDFRRVDEIPAQEVGYNMEQLKDAGLIEAEIIKSNTGDNAIGSAIARRLTSTGHDFLDEIRDLSFWGKIKSKVKEKGLDLTFDTIKAAIAALTKAAFSQGGS